MLSLTSFYPLIVGAEVTAARDHLVTYITRVTTPLDEGSARRRGNTQHSP